MTQNIRAGNHPVVAYMREAGQKAHQKYQSTHSSECTVSEYPVADMKADCISAAQCWVIEVKPNNDAAYRLGKQQAGDAANLLSTDFDTFKALVAANANFKSCWRKEFRPKVVLYKFCPEINDDLSEKSTDYTWGAPQD
jgi:hypothetical protein